MGRASATLLPAVLAGLSAVAGCSATLTVRDARSGEPIAGATVLTLPPGRPVAPSYRITASNSETTDRRGQASLGRLDGPARLLVVCEGYEPAVVPVEPSVYRYRVVLDRQKTSPPPTPPGPPPTGTPPRPDR